MNLVTNPAVLKALGEMGFRELTEVQQKAIPLIVQGEDVVVQSHTGTGKTAAFAIPIIEKISKERFVQAIVLVPTRELAGQVATDFRKIGKYSGVQTSVVYGGVGLGQQVEEIEHGAQIVIGTPGRVLDLISRGDLDISQVKFFVLDEADLMLAMGFQRDVEKIISHSPKERQTMLFCVDFPEEILAMAKKHMHYPQRVKLVLDDKSAQTVSQSFYQVIPGRKLGALLFLLGELKPSRAIIFCKTKHRVKDLAMQLSHNGIRAEGLQGDLPQTKRNRIMQLFKEGKVPILIATDVASRGIHVDKVSHIFNFELPHDINYYIHRIGRTGRMHEAGEAITLCYSDELGLLGQAERMMGKSIEEKFLPANLPAPKFVKRFSRNSSYSGGHGFSRDFSQKKRFGGNRFGQKKFSPGNRGGFKKRFQKSYGEEYGTPVSRE